MNTINTICTVLTVIFVFGLFLLVIQIIYVFSRRQSLHGLSLSTSAGVQFSGDSSFFSLQQPPKELLYLFCWKNQASRIEPAAASTAPPFPVAAPPFEADVEEMLKWRGMYGPPRGLFTIREEEREEIIDTLQVGENNKNSDNNIVILNIADGDERKSTTGIEVIVDEEVEVLEGLDDATPFDTPLASPPYYTPSSSPPRSGVVLGGLC